MGSPGYFSPLSQTPQRSPAYQPSEVQSPYSNPYTSPAYTSPQYTSPQYVSQSPRNNIGSPQDLTMQYPNTRPPTYSQSQFDPMYGQPQDLSVSQPQDLSMALPQDLSKTNKPIDFSNPNHSSQPQQQSPYQQQIQSQPVNLAQSPQQQQQSQQQQQQYQGRPTVVQQKPLHVMVNDPYRQPSTPGMPMTPSGSQHSNPGTPQPNTPHNISQP